MAFLPPDVLTIQYPVGLGTSIFIYLPSDTPSPPATAFGSIWVSQTSVMPVRFAPLELNGPVPGAQFPRQCTWVLTYSLVEYSKAVLQVAIPYMS